MNQSQPKHNGFTLLELVVVLVIMLVMFGVSAPMLGKYYRTHRVDQVVKKFTTVLKYSHQHAIFKKEPVTVFIDLDSGEYWYETLSEDEYGYEESIKLGRGRLPAHYKFSRFIDRIEESDDDYGEVMIGFHPDGTARDSEIEMKWIPREGDKGKIFNISINPYTSRVTVEYHYATDYELER